MAEPRKPAAEAGATRRGERRSVWPEDRAPAVVIYQGAEGRWARLRDLSRQGIGLVLSHGVTPGTVLVVCLRCGASTLDLDRSVRVLHSEPEPCGTWRVGGAFTRPLNDGELELFLTAAHQRDW